MADQTTQQTTQTTEQQTTQVEQTQQTTQAQTEAPAERFVPLPRFEAVTAQKYDAIRRAEAAEAKARDFETQLSQLTQRQVPPPEPRVGDLPQAPRQPDASLNRSEIERLAGLQAQALRFNERCNESVAQGRKAYGDFDAAIDSLRQVAPTMDAQGRPTLPQTFVEAALATGRAHDVMYALGKDSSEADRLMSLSGDPIRQASELTRFAMGLKAPAGSVEPKVEGAESAPKVVVRNAALAEPIKQVVGGNRGLSVKDMPIEDPDLPIEEFMRRRNEEAGRSRRANGRFR